MQQITRLLTWLRAHPRIHIGIVGSILITIWGGVGIYAWSATTPPPLDRTPIKITKKSPPKPKLYSNLTGNQVTDEAALTQAVTAIMIENSPDARPQSGLKEAGVVYEAIAEGGITRFLALYQQEKPELIGPVRSLRMYYIDWLAPYQASAAHIGGSAAALTEIRNGNYRDIDEFFNSSSYWRARDRAAPHNVYTSFKKLDALNHAKGFTSSEFKSFPRSDSPSSGSSANSISIRFSSGTTYATSYTYDASSKTYKRSVGGAIHTDREKGPISPSVVIAMHVEGSTVLEDGYRTSITTSSTGKAEVFQNGTVIECSWRKNSRSEPLELIGTDGQPIELARGQTWIAAVPNTTGASSWQ